MPFTVSQKTLEALEWPQVLARLAERCATPRARAHFLPAADPGEEPPDRFEATLAGVRLRLAETSEARRILEQRERAPLAGAGEPAPALARARRGGALAPQELQELAGTLDALCASERFLRSRGALAPQLAARAEGIAPASSDLARLAQQIRASILPSGELSDDASPALREARSEARRVEAELERSAGRLLASAQVAPHLSDDYFTLRNDRYVLPVRADSRGPLRGIVHDASSSGATLFLEPESLVEPNNRRKQLGLEVEREQLRVLHELSTRAAALADAIESGVAALERIDRAFARAQLSLELDASEPEIGEAGVLRLPLLRHPLIPRGEAIASDLELGLHFSVLVVSGPNAGGKTVALKSLALALLFARAGLHVCAAAPARVDDFDAVFADIGDEQDLAEQLSTFSAHAVALSRMLQAATSRSLVVLDEIGVGTDPSEGAALAQSVLEAFAERGTRVAVTTHYNLLKEMAEVDRRFANACVELDEQSGLPSFRLRMGHPGASSALAVAARMGLPGAVLERARGLLEREDRRLDRMLAELASTRAELEREQREALRVRSESEAARDAYRGRLEQLQQRREQLVRGMREELDAAFRDAHARVAAVIRDLQRGGSARDAAHARERLLGLEQGAREAERLARAAPIAGDAVPPQREAEALPDFDWHRARIGDPVQLVGSHAGTLASLPDARGRVQIQAGSARLTVPVERVRAAATRAHPARARAAPIASPEPEASASSERCDLRGLRVDEALDRIQVALDRAALGNRVRLVIVHGVGTGALRDAVQRHLRESPYVRRFHAAPPDEGGDGATIAEL